MRRFSFLLAACLVALPAPAHDEGRPPATEEPIDWALVGRIRDEGFRRSQVFDVVRHLTEEIGPRLTGSTAMTAANEWTRAKLAEWGLANAAVEPWGTFGKRWSLERTSLHLVEPYFLPIPALPKAWTPSTGGKVRGELFPVKLETAEDLAKYKGKLAGKVLLLDDAKEAKPGTEPLVDRHDDVELAELCQYEIPTAERAPTWRDEAGKRWRFRRDLREFLLAEKVVATLEVSSRESTLVRVMGDSFAYEPGAKLGVPALVVSYEHYNRLVRLAERLGEKGGARVELAVDAEVGEDVDAANTVAEIPGSDHADELVLLGGHLDSWHGGTGATDNAAGVAMAMEAVRILKALGVQPRRTIRIVLWSGEEQGLLGSRAYVEKHFARRPLSEDADQKDLPKTLRKPAGVWEFLPEHAKVSAYFNLDNGGGKVRGIYTQDNLAVIPIFERWMRPLADLGVTTVTANPTGATDHVSFDRAGLPGFQFIQDELDYGTRTHHSTADVFDHLSREDLMQGAVVLATFVYHAAQRDELLPRKDSPRND